MLPPKLNITEGQKLPQFDLPVDYIAFDDVRADLLKFYAAFPCKIYACIVCYVERGSISARINLWDFEIKQQDLVFITPGSFIQIKDVSDDVKISFQGYSSAFLQKMNFWKLLEPTIFNLFRAPVFSLSQDIGEVVRLEFTTFTRAFSSGLLSVKASINATISLVLEVIEKSRQDNSHSPTQLHTSREEQIVTEFLQLAFENYREEHKISFYAHEANLSLSHFCNVVSRTIEITPQEVIMNLIIMDAKTQLKGTRLTVARIASSLGFNTPTTFNRYFRTYTGMTPQEYRNN